MAFAGGNGELTYKDVLAGAATGRFRNLHEIFLFGTVADRNRRRIRHEGSPISLSTACSSGATAIQLGVEAIRRGDAAAALCIGTDGSVHAEALIRFSLLSALSTQNDPPEEAAKPFSKNRDGFVMGEGAGALVVDYEDKCGGARGAHPRRAGGAAARWGRLPSHALLAGRQTDHRRNPGGARRCWAEARPDRHDQRPWHLDSRERQDGGDGLPSGVGDSVPPITSNKSMVGHTLTAAGAVEACSRCCRSRLAACRRRSITICMIPPFARRRRQQAARHDGHQRDLELLRLRGQNTCLVMTAEPK